jgi:lambda repressor-like predicted transcriptional regulator
MRKIVRGGGLKANTLKSMLKSTYDRSQVEVWDTGLIRSNQKFWDFRFFSAVTSSMIASF